MEETQLLCGLKREDFQTTIDGKKTDLYVLRNSQGNEVALTNYGGAVVAIMMPDKEGKHANIIQGHDSIKGVMESPALSLYPRGTLRQPHRARTLPAPRQGV